MISTCFQSGFDLSFENFRLWGVIRNLRLRHLLEQCEQALDSNLPFESLAGSIVAFKHIASEIGKVSDHNYRPPRLPKLRAFSDYTTRNSPNAFQEVKSLEQWISNITTNLEQLHIDSILGSLGLLLAETQEFRRISGEVVVHEMMNGNWRVCHNSTRTPEELKECANFTLGYLSRLVSRAQEVYPEALARVVFKELLNDQEWMREAQSQIERS